MLDRAFVLLGKRFVLLAVLALVPAMAEFAVALFRTVEDSQSLLRWQTAVPVALMVAGELAYAVAIGCCFQALLFPGRVLSVRAVVRATAPRLPAFLLTRLLLQLVLGALLLLIPTVLLRSGVGGSLKAVNAMLAACSVLLGIWLTLCWGLVPVTIIVERKAFMRGTLRGMELMQTSFGKTMWRDSAVLRAIAALIPVAIAVVTVIAAAQAWNVYMAKPLLSVLDVAGDLERRAACVTRGVISLLCMPLMAAMLTTLYVECRMRRDGMDFQVRLIENKATMPDLAAGELPDW